MSDGVGPDDLPDYDRPPVIEIVGAAQFVALPRLGLEDLVRVGQRLDDYELREIQPELPPMTEAPPGHPDQPQLITWFGQQPPPRGLFHRTDGRFVAQVQRDRIAINERRREPGDYDPSSQNVQPQLAQLATVVEEALVETEGYGPAQTTFVELTYLNRIEPVAGVWQGHNELHNVLRILNERAGDDPFGTVEQAALRFSFPLFADDMFRGRLYVVAEPAHTPEALPILQLNLFSRRIVGNGEQDSWADAYEQCHRDVVAGFTAITTAAMHEAWGRTR